jgi:hypothetical protein
MIAKIGSRIIGEKKCIGLYCEECHKSMVMGSQEALFDPWSTYHRICPTCGRKAEKIGYAFLWRVLRTDLSILSRGSKGVWFQYCLYPVEQFLKMVVDECELSLTILDQKLLGIVK